MVGNFGWLASVRQPAQRRWPLEKGLFGGLRALGDERDRGGKGEGRRREGAGGT